MADREVRGFFNPRTFPNVVAAAVVALALLPAYWLIVDRQPVANTVSEVLDSRVRQGDFLQIRYKLTWNGSCKIVAFRYIIDQMRVEWPISAQERIVTPGPAEFLIRVPVPNAAATGEAIYRATIRYECNPMQRIFPLEQELHERRFVILQADGDKASLLEPGTVFEAPSLVRRFADRRR